HREHLVEVVDLLAELFQEYLADLVVDLVAGGLETARDRRRRGRRRGGGRILRCAHLLDAAVDEGGNAAVDVPGRHLRATPGVRFVFTGVRHRGRRLGQRPVAERFEAAAGDVEDVFAVQAILAQRLEVVLEAGQRVGKG